MLDEAKLDELQRQYGKIGTVEFSGHVVVFRKPSRTDVREYRRMQGSDAERPDAMDRLAQATIVAFDDVTDPNAARTLFTGSFLVEFPMAVSHGRFAACLSVLAGLVEAEDAEDLGKGVTVRSSRPKPSPTV